MERSLVPVKPIAVTHEGKHPAAWMTIEVELADRMLAEIVRRSVRDKCSKTQTLRALLARATDLEYPSGV